MPGIVQFLTRNELLEVRRNWRYAVSQVHQQARSQSWNYVLFVVQERLVLAAKVLSVCAYPNNDQEGWLVEFSRFVENPAVVNFVSVGRFGDRTEWLKEDADEKILELFKDSEIVRSAEEPRLNISIQEAVAALSLRYEIDEANISISLHN
ncbi:hypothetical protein [Pseudomonas sp. zbq_4]|uniref:hypothetical protein n=1 Tax=Pseudomonas sp. zbq_4 TaxID=3367240 RepID=UPI00370CFF02